MIQYRCNRPAGHGGGFHEVRTSDGWLVARWHRQETAAEAATAG